jgi:two-component system cell cycle sensor histidine kinase/response regulator CckA
VGPENAISPPGGEGQPQARLAAIVESSFDAIISTTLDGTITSWNAGAAATFGYTAGEIIGQNASVLFPSDRAAELVPILDGMRRGRRVAPYETKRLRKDGTIIDVLVSISPIRDDSGAITGVGGVALDITERNWTEAERWEGAARRREAERLESLGRLAGAVGRDFGALLDAILNCAARIGEEIATADDPSLQADVRQIQEDGGRAARLARDLLVFSGRDPAPPGETDLNAVLASTHDLMQASTGPRIEVLLTTASGLPTVAADPVRIEQVLLNLAVNADEAMPSGGALTITTSLADLSDVQDAEWPGARPGQYVDLAVSDTGCGMDSETMRHIFEPFFTTKPPGHQVTGLGLSTSYGIVTGIGGGITVASEEGIGTTFHVYLPAVRALVAAAPARQPLGVQGHGETILVVGDEPAELEIVARILQHGGYRALEASTSEEALSLLSSHEIQLILTDADVPGSALLNQAAEAKPGVRVLRMSGPAPGTREPGPVTTAETPHVVKPVTSHDLLEKVRTVLAATSGKRRTPGVDLPELPYYI